jgi:hypothetical protein
MCWKEKIQWQCYPRASEKWVVSKCVKYVKIRWFCLEKVRIEALKGKIFNFNNNNENHRVYPSTCDLCLKLHLGTYEYHNLSLYILFCIDMIHWRYDMEVDPDRNME